MSSDEDLAVAPDNPELSDETRVLLVLAHGPTTVAEIAGYTGLDHTQVARALQYLAREEGLLRFRRYESGTQYRLDKHPLEFTDE